MLREGGVYVAQIHESRENYLEAFEKLKDIENVMIVDGRQTPEQISEVIWNYIKKYFEK